MPRELPPLINRLILEELLIKENLLEVASLVKAYVWRGPVLEQGPTTESPHVADDRVHRESPPVGPARAGRSQGEAAGALSYG